MDESAKIIGESVVGSEEDESSKENGESMKGSDVDENSKISETREKGKGNMGQRTLPIKNLDHPEIIRANYHKIRDTLVMFAKKR